MPLPVAKTGNVGSAVADVAVLLDVTLLDVVEATPVVEGCCDLLEDDTSPGMLMFSVTGALPKLVSRVVPISNWKELSSSGPPTCSTGYMAPIEVALRKQPRTPPTVGVVHCKGATESPPREQVEIEQEAGSCAMPSIT